MKERPVSQSIYELSCELMPAGVNSPVRSFKGFGMTPMIVEKGKGDTIWDVDGNPYIDFCCSWGSLILGHAPDAVVEAAIDQVRKGSSFGIATLHELALSQKINTHIPSIEKLRFVSSGSEATMSAIRLARGFTDRPLIIKFNGHYHGHSDSLLIQAGSGVSHLPQSSSKGIPEGVIRNTASLPFNDLETCRNFIRSRDDLAAVLLEPITGNMGVIPTNPDFMAMLREETEKKGALLIFDEVITGFRVGLKGAQQKYNIMPDLICLGKVIGGGYPVAAFGGSREIMELIAPLGAIYQGGTLSGNPVAMRAGLETLKAVEQPHFYSTLEARTEAFLAPIRQKVAGRNLPIAIPSVGSMFSIFFGVRHANSREDLKDLDIPLFIRFFKTLFDQGIYFSPSAYEAHFLSTAHTDENLEKTQQIILNFLDTLS